MTTENGIGPGLETKILTLLTSIDASLKRIARVYAAPSTTTDTKPGGQVASDAELDSKYGDEKIAFSPRDWTGENVKGRPMSTVPPACLDLLALAYDYFAEKNDREKAVDTKGNPKSTYDRRSAARARGWAKRLRAGWKPPPVEEIPADEFDEMGDPF